MPCAITWYIIAVATLVALSKSTRRSWTPDRPYARLHLGEQQRNRASSCCGHQRDAALSAPMAICFSRNRRSSPSRLGRVRRREAAARPSFQVIVHALAGAVQVQVLGRLDRAVDVVQPGEVGGRDRADQHSHSIAPGAVLYRRPMGTNFFEFREQVYGSRSGKPTGV